MGDTDTDTQEFSIIGELKAAWERLQPRVPEKVKMWLHFSGHYTFDERYSSNPELAGQEWSVHLDDRGLEKDLGIVGSLIVGKGSTPDEALDKALADLASKRARVTERELHAFREWRAARERRGRTHLPIDQDGWDRAVKKRKKAEAGK